MPPSSDSDIKTAFVAFRKECIWLMNCYNISHALFGGDKETERVLDSVARLFFCDLNQIMIEYWFLLVGRLTDDARSRCVANLTVQNLLEGLRHQRASTPEIEKAATALQNYRKLIVPARNKRVAHLDKTTLLQEATLGEHHEHALFQFLNDIQTFNDLVGVAVGAGPLDFRVTSGPGDVHDLISALKQADLSPKLYRN